MMPQRHSQSGTAIVSICDERYGRAPHSISKKCKLLKAGGNEPGVEVSADLHDFEFKVLHISVSKSPSFDGFYDVIDGLG
jgi:hypothetical protein